VRNHNNRPAESDLARRAEPIEASIEPPEFSWHAQVGQLLTQAAMLCVENDVDLENFMKGAWSAYVESRPGMRDYLEEMQLREQLEEIRKLGHMAEA
jgi:hypothetical protein